MCETLKQIIVAFRPTVSLLFHFSKSQGSSFLICYDLDVNVSAEGYLDFI